MMNKHGGMDQIAELERAIPVRVKDKRFYHKGVFFNLALSIVKNILPKHARETMQIGLELEKKLDWITSFSFPPWKRPTSAILRI